MTTVPAGRPDAALVTLVIAGFDVAPYAREALESVQAQTFTGWRAILIDDHSTDGTREIFAEAAGSDDRFTFVPQRERRGLGAARNAGLDRVRTPFVGGAGTPRRHPRTHWKRLRGWCVRAVTAPIGRGT